MNSISPKSPNTFLSASSRVGRAMTSSAIVTFTVCVSIIGTSAVVCSLCA